MKLNTQKRMKLVEDEGQSTFGQACLVSCQKLLGQLEAAKARIQAEFRGSLDEHEHLLELALNEAEAMAWQTGYPQLLFPTLAAEKARDVAHWHERQQRLRQGTPPLAFAV